MEKALLTVFAFVGTLAVSGAETSPAITSSAFLNTSSVTDGVASSTRTYTCNTDWTTPQLQYALDDCLGALPYPENDRVTSSLMSSKMRIPECSSISMEWESKYFTAENVTTFQQAVSMDPAMRSEYLGDIPLVSLPVTHYGNPTMTNPYFCCGKCRIHWGNVKVLYWPKAGASTECLDDIGPNGHAWESWLLSMEEPEWMNGGQNEWERKKVKRMLKTPEASAPQSSTRSTAWVALPAITPGPMLQRSPQNTTNTVTGDDGFVYTSPYIYFEIPHVMAMDECPGFVGDIGVSTVRLSLPPDEVSSVVPQAGIGCFGDFILTDEQISSACSWTSYSFNFADIPCPPTSLRQWGSNSFIYNTANAYNPLLAPHPSLTMLDPAWSTCTPQFGWDPFTTLRPYANMADPTPSSKPESPTAAPASTVPTMFAPTSHSRMVDPTPAPAKDSGSDAKTPVAKESHHPAADPQGDDKPSSAANDGGPASEPQEPPGEQTDSSDPEPNADSAHSGDISPGSSQDENPDDNDPSNNDPVNDSNPANTLSDSTNPSPPSSSPNVQPNSPNSAPQDNTAIQLPSALSPAAETTLPLVTTGPTPHAVYGIDTLQVGQKATVSDQIVSVMSSGGNAVIVGLSTAVQAPDAGATGEVGGYIWSALGGESGAGSAGSGSGGAAGGETGGETGGVTGGGNGAEATGVSIAVGGAQRGVSWEWGAVLMGVLGWRLGYTR